MATREERRNRPPRVYQAEDKARSSYRTLYYERYPEMKAVVKRQQTASYFKNKYGITLEERDAFLAAQGGLCALPHCRRAIRFGGRIQPDSAHLDHCHETNQVRGVLCAHCNTALGKLGDTVESIRAVLRYLECATVSK
jgi:hypothetical protein